MAAGWFRVEKARAGRQGPAVSTDGRVAHEFHGLISDVDTSSGRCKNIASVPTPLNSRTRPRQKRKSEGTYTYNPQYGVCRSLRATDGDPQCKMENVSDREGTGDNPRDGIQANLAFLHSHDPCSFLNKARDCLSASVPSSYRSRRLQP